MTDLIRHRGPDGEGQWTDRNVGLGHRRLSIIDLSEAASQPMISKNGRFAITFNGEIYNYKELRNNLKKSGFPLSSDSDTEVILAMFELEGIQCIAKFRGMFAFAIYDVLKKELFLVRDRLGIKPVFYSHTPDELIFASEIKAIAGVSANLTFNRNSFWGFLRTSVFTQNETVFTEIKSLEPGCWLHVSSTGIFRMEKYWDLADSFALPTRSFSSERQAVSDFLSVFESTINYHMVADVPVGGFLSGGLDSSSVLAMMRKALPQGDIFTSSIIFKNYPAYYNEEEYSDLVAKNLVSNHHKFDFTSNFLGKIDDLAWHSDEPFGITASYALYFLSQATVKNVKVVLTGDGADELLAGYSRYLDTPPHWTYKYRNIIGAGSWSLRTLLQHSSLDSPHLLDLFLTLSVRSGQKDFLFADRNVYSPAIVYGMLNKEFLFDAWDYWRKGPNIAYYNVLSGQSDLRKKLFALLKTRMIDEMFIKVDRMTMAHSLEARVPFMDHVFVDYCCSLNDDLKLNNSNGPTSQNKHILRLAMNNYLPKEIIFRKKHGLDIPLTGLFNSTHFSLIKAEIFSGRLIKTGILNVVEIGKLFNNLKSIKPGDLQFLINIFIFEKWHKAYQLRIPGFSMRF